MRNSFFRFLSTKICPIVLGFIFLMSSAASAQIPEMENKVPENIPLKIETKNSDSPKWVYDMEIEVTNTGKKPIYFLFLSLTFDLKDERGVVFGFPLIFGNNELYSTEGLSSIGDAAIQPGEKYTFKIKKSSADAWMKRKLRTNSAEPQKAFLKLGWLSFGDGTGFKGGGSMYKKKLN